MQQTVTLRSVCWARLCKGILGMALLGIFLLQGCQRQKAQLSQEESYVFGTRVEISIQGVPSELAHTATQAVFREFDRLHRLYHAWKPSELSALNEAIAQGQAHPVSPELAELITHARQLAETSGFLFDPGIGRLIRLWGFQADEFAQQPPNPEIVKKWLEHRPSIADLKLEAGKVYSRNPQVALDFGGYLKGWALDRARTLLKQHGIQNALINIGGNILALGEKSPGTPWQIGIQHPRKPGVLATLQLRDGEAIGTSGDYQRYFEANGQRFSHLLDPRTGYPGQQTQAVTVLIPAGEHSGTLSDAQSKPLFLAGDEWLGHLPASGIQQALRVTAAGELEATPSMIQRLKIPPGTPLRSVQ